MAQDRRVLETVVRALEALEIVENQQSVGPSELAEIMDITKSTAHGYLYTLEEAGYVINESGKYEISHKLLGMGNRIKYRSRFYHAGKAPIRELAIETGEPAHLGIVEADEWVLLHSDGDIEDFGAYPGLRFPLHTQAPGKVILAHMDSSERRQILESTDFREITAHTITDPTILREELQTIRTQGYCVDWDQQILGIGNIAFPIIVNDELIGSISIACASGKLQNEGRREELVQRVKEAADQVVISLRYKS